MKPYGRALVRVLLTVAVILPATAACGTNATPGRSPAPTVTTPPTGTRAERDAHVPDAYADADRHRAGTVIGHG